MAALPFSGFLNTEATHCVGVPFCDLFPQKKADCLQQFPDTQLLFGEDFTIHDQTETQYYGYSKAGQYWGWIDQSALMPFIPANICVSAPWVQIYSLANMKSTCLMTLPMGAFLQAQLDQLENGFYFVPYLNGWVHHTHILLNPTPHFIDHSQKFLYAPYRYGGRTAQGIDCSALVQVAARLCGIALPRDTKDQINSPYAISSETPLKTGDIIHFKNHVGIMVDDHRFINATDRHMRVIIEDFEWVQKDYQSLYNSPILAIHNLFNPLSE
jgi:hypothetical protein